MQGGREGNITEDFARLFLKGTEHGRIYEKSSEEGNTAHEKCGFSTALDDCGDALAYADAHGAQRIARFGLAQLVGRGGYQASAAGTKWMADGDGPAVRIYVFGIVGDSEVARNGERLRREGFVQFNHIHLREFQPGLIEDFSRRGRRGETHDSRGDSHHGGGHNA